MNLLILPRIVRSARVRWVAGPLLLLAAVGLFVAGTVLFLQGEAARLRAPPAPEVVVPALRVQDLSAWAQRVPR